MYVVWDACIKGGGDALTPLQEEILPALPIQHDGLPGHMHGLHKLSMND